MPDSVFVWTAGDVLGIALFVGVALYFVWVSVGDRWRRRKR